MAHLFAATRVLDETSAEARAYNYVIAIGCLALVAVYVPAHVVFGARGRIVWLGLGLATGAISAVAAIVGAAIGGTLWQVLPTAIFMLFLSILILLQILGGWHVLRQQARAPGRISASILEERHWRADVSRDEYARLVAASNIGLNPLLPLASQADQDAVAVAVYTKLKTSEKNLAAAAIEPTNLGGVGTNPNNIEGARSVARPRHEPIGLIILGSVRLASVWLEQLLDRLAADRGRRNKVSIFHHVCMAVWWLGMLLGALAKTGFMPDENGGSDNLRTSGIWIQALLLLIAVYGFPYSRSIVRYGARMQFRSALLALQAIVSFVIGVVSIALAREPIRDGNLIAYAISLMIAATAAAVWSSVAVLSYAKVVTYILSRRSIEETVGRRFTAYVAALLTRPRHGYDARGQPTLQWGDADKNGQAPLIVHVDPNEGDVTSDGVDDRVMTQEAGAEWAMLEQAARGL